jgi:hypothetical protein
MVLVFPTNSRITHITYDIIDIHHNGIYTNNITKPCTNSTMQQLTTTKLGFWMPTTIGTCDNNSETIPRIVIVDVF